MRDVGLWTGLTCSEEMGAEKEQEDRVVGGLDAIGRHM